MIPNEHALMLYKFGEKRWIEKITDGKLSFSCGGAFILQAKKTGNTIQGDLLEGVFARLLNNNPKILEMKTKFGADLEILSDGTYSFLRRKSAKLKPIFCAFAYTAGDALQNNKIISSGKQKLRFEFDQRMYEGFSDQIKSNVVTDPFRFTLLFIQPKPFVDSIKQALRFENIPYQMRKVKYVDMKSDEFFIEPNDNYDELFYKSADYGYQHEVRICLTGEKFNNVFERYSLNTQKLDKNDYVLCHSEIYVEFIANIQVVEDDWEGGGAYGRA